VPVNSLTRDRQAQTKVYATFNGETVRLADLPSFFLSALKLQLRSSILALKSTTSLKRGGSLCDVQFRVVSLTLVCAAYIVASSANAQTQFSASSEQVRFGPVLQLRKQQVRTFALPPEKYEKAVAYSRAQYAIHFIGVAYSLLVLLAILALRIAPIFRDVAERVSQLRFVQSDCIRASTLVHVRCAGASARGLSTSPRGAIRHIGSELGSWLWDWTKGQVIELSSHQFLPTFFMQ